MYTVLTLVACLLFVFVQKKNVTNFCSKLRAKNPSWDTSRQDSRRRSIRWEQMMYNITRF